MHVFDCFAREQSEDRLGASRSGFHGKRRASSEARIDLYEKVLCGHFVPYQLDCQRSAGLKDRTKSLGLFDHGLIHTNLRLEHLSGSDLDAFARDNGNRSPFPVAENVDRVFFSFDIGLDDIVLHLCGKHFKLFGILHLECVDGAASVFRFDECRECAFILSPVVHRHRSAEPAVDKKLACVVLVTADADHLGFADHHSCSDRR